MKGILTLNELITTSEFKACTVSSIFLILAKGKHLKSYEKCFLFYLKSYFRSRDIQLFSLPFQSFQIQRAR